MTAFHYLEPVDVLVLRGNRLFGDPGSHGDAVVPPWPSVASGAIRSQILVRSGIDLQAFARGEAEHPTLGSLDRPGAFALTTLQPARLEGERVEPFFRLPADLMVTEEEQIHTLSPSIPDSALGSSATVPLLPALASDRRAKPAAGYWLDRSGWEKYLVGQLPAAGDLVHSRSLWELDPRIGIGLSAERRSAEDGRLFSWQAVAFRPGAGLLAGVEGDSTDLGGTIRLGGDGRGAVIRHTEYEAPEPDYAAIADAGRCRLVLMTPGIFRDGWLPGHSTGPRVELGEIRGRLVSAAFGRPEVVSGWDLARWAPKAAERAVPVGAVYWLDDLDTTPAALRKLVKNGLWADPCEDLVRRAEGFNRCAVAAW